MASSDMFSTIYVVGGAGYIGQRLLPQLEAQYPWAPVWCVDLVAPRRHERYIKADCREWEPEDPHSVVVWLASVQEPSHEVDAFLASEIMVDSPLYMLQSGLCRHLVYFSSIRAVEARSRPTTYSDEKRGAEAALPEYCPADRTYAILRPGTVFGGFNDGLPVRTTTVPNKYLLTGELPDEHYRAYVCPMEMIVGSAGAAVNYAQMPHRNTVRNVGYGDIYTRTNLPQLRSYHGSLALGDPEPCPDTNALIEEHCQEDE